MDKQCSLIVYGLKVQDGKFYYFSAFGHLLKFVKTVKTFGLCYVKI